jgi:hypothetical protein
VGKHKAGGQGDNANDRDRDRDTTGGFQSDYLKKSDDDHVTKEHRDKE